MVRIVLTSDNHLNAYYAKMPPRVLMERRRRIRQAWTQVVDYALEHDCHLFLQAGDMFDMPDPRTTELVAAARDFRRLHDAGVKVFCIGGTHDVHRMATTGVLALRIYHETGHAHVFNSAIDPAPVVTEVDGVRIAVGGLSVSHNFGRGDNPLEGVAFEADADFKILLMHYGVEGTIHPDANEPILTVDALTQIGVDVVGVGHIHQHRAKAFGSTTVITPGSTERHAFGERGIQPGFYYLEVNEKGLQRCRHIDVTPQLMEDIVIRTPELDEDEPTESLMARIHDVAREEQLLKVRVEGPMTPATFHKLRLRDVYQAGSESNFYFDLDTRGLHVSDAPRLSPVEAGSASISQREEIAQVADELMAQSDDPEARALLLEARNRALSNYDLA
ncbi:MAG TPA: DNA repair exonuclease [Armatimonadota bacterium]